MWINCLADNNPIAWKFRNAKNVAGKMQTKREIAWFVVFAGLFEVYWPINVSMDYRVISLSFPFCVYHWHNFTRPPPHSVALNPGLKTTRMENRLWKKSLFLSRILRENVKGARISPEYYVIIIGHDTWHLDLMWQRQKTKNQTEAENKSIFRLSIDT